MSDNVRFTVSRQHRWPDGLYIVEITDGGIDYVNPDCLSIVGEFETASEAVEAAIKDAKEWRKKRPDRKIYLACGVTHGFTAQLDEMPMGAATYAHLRKWAKEYDATIPRCAHCGGLMPVEGGYGVLEIGEFDCCSEYCAEERAYHYWLDAALEED